MGDAADDSMVDMDDEDQDSFSCRYCKASVYWGWHYSTTGGESRRLFSDKNHRLHDCRRVQPNADDFEVIPDGR
jgi:hypothetical protein